MIQPMTPIITDEKEKCLVTEAMDKCQCEWCKMSRQMRDISIKQTIQLEAMKIHYHALKEAGVIPK